jgi:hypothetical protein
MPQNVLLQQPALQAALAAQCMAAQSQSQLLSPQSTDTPKPAQPQQTSCGSSGPSALPSQEETPSQEMSVAQMMMTLARASNKNTMSLNGNSTQNETTDGSGSQ